MFTCKLYSKLCIKSKVYHHLFCSQLFPKRVDFFLNPQNIDPFSWIPHRNVSKEELTFWVDSQKGRLGMYYGGFSHCFYEYRLRIGFYARTTPPSTCYPPSVQEFKWRWRCQDDLSQSLFTWFHCSWLFSLSESAVGAGTRATNIQYSICLNCYHTKEWFLKFFCSGNTHCYFTSTTIYAPLVNKVLIILLHYFTSNSMDTVVQCLYFFTDFSLFFWVTEYSTGGPKVMLYEAEA